jgi:hypothetical protein
MDNFDLKKYLVEGKLHQSSNLNENLEQDVLDFWNQLQDDAEESNGEYESEWDTIFFIEQYPEYEGKEEEINNIVQNLNFESPSSQEDDIDDFDSPSSTRPSYLDDEEFWEKEKLEMLKLDLKLKKEAYKRLKKLGTSEEKLNRYLEAFKDAKAKLDAYYNK